jgi:hypothetical protein
MTEDNPGPFFAKIGSKRAKKTDIHSFFVAKSKMKRLFFCFSQTLDKISGLSPPYTQVDLIFS